MKFPTWLVRTVQVVLVLLVSYGIIRALAPELAKISVDDFKQWKPNALGIALSLVMLLSVYVSHCFLWRNITYRLGGVKPGVQSALRIYFVSSLGRYIPGKLWQVAGLAVLAQKAGISPVAATAASVAAQLAFMSAGLVYLGVMMPWWGHNGPLIGAVVLFGLIEIAFLSRKWWRRKLGQKIGAALELIESIQWQDAVKWWIAYALTWVLLGASFVVFVRAFVPLDRSQMQVVGGTVAASYLAGYVFIFAPAGLGVRESVMTVLLKSVMPAPAALVISVVSRLWFTAAELLPLALIPVTRDE